MNRIEKHKAKMSVKAQRVVMVGFTPMDDKRFRSTRMALAAQGRTIRPNVGPSSVSYTSHAQNNFRTGEPHEHKREISRNRRRAA